MIITESIEMSFLGSSWKIYYNDVFNGTISVIARPETIVLTQHSRRRFMERGILLEDVENVLDNGSIIEEYPDDYSFPSCLILGKSNEKDLHVCASLDEGYSLYSCSYKMGIRFENQKGGNQMKCMRCGKEAYKSTTSEAIEMGFGLLVIRNIPCYKCLECDDIFYTGDVVKK